MPSSIALIPSGDTTGATDTAAVNTALGNAGAGGSVLLGPGHERLADYLDLPHAEREALRATLAGSATHAGGVLGQGPPLERWADALMAELPAGTRRVGGAAGVALLTPAEAGSYTAHSQ